jgi:hypothetical protein
MVAEDRIGGGVMRCLACGLRMIDVDGNPYHVTCDPAVPENARIADEFEAHRRKIMGQDTAAETEPDDFTVALKIIHDACLTMRTWSANDLRLMDPRWEKLGRYVRGSACSHAARRKWAHKTGVKVISSSRATNEADVHVWESEIYVDEFRSGLVAAGVSRSTGRQGA